MTASGTRAGCTPSRTRRTTPGAHLAVVSLRHDMNEGVARKQRRRSQDPAAVADTLLAKTGVVDLVAGERQVIQRHSRTIWL
jgi:hypothetical protein